VEEQEIRFTGDDDGRRIAWARSGTGPPLVFSGWWTSHLELNWRDPRFRSYVERLGRWRTVIRYDSPGTGLSVDGDDAMPRGDLEDEVAALGAVIEAASPGPVELFAGSSGAPIGVAYAGAHPERVRRFAVYGGYASGPQIADARSRGAILDLVRDHWGLGSRALADVFVPGATAAEREVFVDFQREAMSPERAARSLESVYRLDVADRLDAVPPGTVVLHRREDRAIPFALGRELAAGLPDATFVALDGADHFPWFGDTDQLLGAAFDAFGIEGEVAEDEPTPRRRPEAQPRVAPDPRVDPGPADPAADQLTKRETEVLALIATGLSDREIAERLVLSPHTVHRHVANLRTKLGLPTRAAAVAAAAKRGLI
jgi:pimeloyl-ACP methyl ester carboxylesterase/DNA-binding CsgD family transcriptional regulator